MPKQRRSLVSLSHLASEYSYYIARGSEAQRAICRFDGILGLAYDRIAVNHITPPFFEMVNQKLLDSAVFSFRLGSSEEDGGEAIFGGVDASAYTGSITYVPVRQKAYWEVELEKVSLGGDVLELENTGAAIDTGKSSHC